MFEDSTIVTVQLDNTDENFHVQKALLCNVSKYFVRALTGEFIESKSNTLRLPGCKKATFSLFLYWLCHRSLPENLTTELESEAEIPEGSDKWWTPSYNQQQLISLWGFGDIYLMPSLQNEAMRMLVKNVSTFRIGVEAVKLAAELWVEDSPQRNFVMERVAGEYSDWGLHDHEIDYLGAIPGVMKDMLTILRIAWTGEEALVQQPNPDISRLLVDETTQRP